MPAGGVPVVYLVILALICPLLGVYVAAQKNRSAGEGLALGCLLGPFGVIIAALLPTLAKPRPRAAVDDDDRIRELNELPLVFGENRVDDEDVDRFIRG